MGKVKALDNKMMPTIAKVKICPELQIKFEKFDHELSAIEPTCEVKIEPGFESNVKAEKIDTYGDKISALVPIFQPKIEKSDSKVSRMVTIKIEPGFESNVKAVKIEDCEEDKSIDQPKCKIVVATNRWLQTIPFGSVVKGSPFVPFKMPFVGTDLQPCPLENRFDILDLLKAFPNIGLIVDLSNKLRTYRVSDLMAFGVEYVNIPVNLCELIPKNEGHNNAASNRFIDICSRYSTKNPGKLIGVHGLLGHRATGYMICKALENLGFSLRRAMKRFKIARGSPIHPVLAGVLEGSVKKWRRLRKNSTSKNAKKQRKAQRKAKNKLNHWQQVKPEPKYRSFETHKSCVALPFNKKEFS